MTSAPPHSPSRWPAVKAFLDELLALEPDARRARLDELAARDPALAAEVADLLRYAEDTKGFLTSLPPGEAFALPKANERVGPWRLVRPIGHGGMGVVFEAARADGAYEQRVALKVVSGAWSRPGLKDRLAAERQMLAGLDHPGIARLIDGGETASGIPYLVMELVDGLALTRHVADHAVPLAGRIRLVVEALEAVQFAHEQLIVHRDLKPSNVLVARDGRVKLLDFGVAKALAPDGAPNAEATRAFTPGYAAPEQIRGEPATAAADVYSMGVLLYEVLTDSHPYDVSSNDPTAIIDAVLMADPERPSRRVAKRRTGAALPRELDAVVMKAMARSSAERYRTALAFAGDLRAFLEHRPLSVRPPSTLYVAGRFVRRHRAGSALAALAVVAILGASVSAIVQAHRADLARAEAERRFNEVRQLANAIIFSYQDALQPLGGQALDVRLKLARDGVGYLDRLTQGGRPDASLLREASLAYQRIGDLLGNMSAANLGLSEEALASYEKARSIREALFARHPGDREEALGIARLHHAIGKTRLALGKPAEAQASLAEARRMIEAHAPVEGEATLLLVRLDQANARSCAVFGYQGDSRGAAEEMRALGPPFERMLTASGRSVPALEARLNYLLAYGALHGCMGDAAAAVGAFDEAERLTRELIAKKPNDAGPSHRRAMILLELGYWRAVAGGPALGLPAMEEARDIAEALYRDHARDAKLRLDLATIYAKLGGLQVRAGQLRAAEDGAKRSEAILRSLLAEAPGNQTFHTLLGSAYNRQSQVAFAERRHAEARRLANQALAELRAGPVRETATKSYIAQVLHYRAGIERAAGDPEAAARSYAESVETAREAMRENPASAELRLTLARSMLALLEDPSAVAGFDAAAAAREALAAIEPLETSGGLPASDRDLVDRARSAVRRFP